MHCLIMTIVHSRRYMFIFEAEHTLVESKGFLSNFNKIVLDNLGIDVQLMSVTSGKPFIIQHNATGQSGALLALRLSGEQKIH